MEIVRRPVSSSRPSHPKKSENPKLGKSKREKLTKPHKAVKPKRKHKPTPEEVVKPKRAKKPAKAHKSKRDKNVDQVGHSGLSIDEKKAQRVKSQLPGYCNLYGEKELFKMVQMDTPPETIAKFMRMRLILLFAPIIPGLIVAVYMYMSGHYIKSILQAIMVGALGGFGFGAVLWAMDIRSKAAQYEAWLIKRQIAFSQFVRMVAAYAPGLAAGTNLFNMMKKIGPRMADKKDKASINRLMIAMQDNPRDPEPWRQFAHEFSTSPRAELTMLTIQRMYLGNVDDEAIQSLAKDSNNDLIRQIDKIIDFKKRKFEQVPTRLTMTCMFLILGVLGLIMFDSFTNMSSKLNGGF